MSGHNKWTQIKHQKGAADQKRGRLFSKLLNSISVAAKSDSNPQFNPRLRAAIQKARESNVPSDNIARAISRASDSNQNLEELTIEAYGPGGSAIIIEAITDNKNRTVAETKKIISENGGKWAESGSVLWSFEKKTKDGEIVWAPKFSNPLNNDNATKLKILVSALENHDDVQKIFTNA